MNIFDSKTWGVALPLAVLFATACGEGASTATTRSCISIENCEAGEICTRGTCAPACTVNADCSGTDTCLDGACVPALGSQTCLSSADCTSPPSPCQVAEGAVCSRGFCAYPDKQCVDPPAPECINDDTRFVSFLSPGTCTVENGRGICTYVRTEGEDCQNCTNTCLNNCAGIECDETNFGCLKNGTPTPTADGCECDYQNVDDGVTCDDGDPCTIAGCQAGACSPTPLQDGDNCRNEDDEPIDNLFCLDGACAECVVDDDCNTDDDVCTYRSCVDGVCMDNNAEVNETECEYPDGVSGSVQPMGQCFEGSCVECITGETDSRCDDGNSCTVDACEANFCESSPRSYQAACALPSDTGASQSGLCTNDPVPLCVECLTEQNNIDGFGNPLNSRCSGNPLPPGLNSNEIACEIKTCSNNSCTTQRAADATDCSGAFGDNATCTNGWCIDCSQPSGNDEAECTTTTAVPDGERGAVCVDSFDNENGDPCTGQAGGNCYQGNCFNCKQYDNSEVCVNWIHNNDGALDQGGRCTPVARTSEGCNDGEYCTVNDQCNAGGACVGSARSCGGVCISTMCDENNDECVPKEDGTMCNTLDCRSNQTCNGGTCSGGSSTCPSNQTCSASQNACVCQPSLTCGVFCCSSGLKCCLFPNEVSMPYTGGGPTECRAPSQSCSEF